MVAGEFVFGSLDPTYSNHVMEVIVIMIVIVSRYSRSDAIKRLSKVTNIAFVQQEKREPAKHRRSNG